MISENVFHQSSSTGFETIDAPGSILRTSPDSRMIFIAKEWIVEIYASSIRWMLFERWGRSFSDLVCHSTKVFFILSCISLAAFSVNVRTRIWSTLQSLSLASSHAKRWERVWVLPVPAPALTTVRGLRLVTASSCSGSPFRLP